MGLDLPVQVRPGDQPQAGGHHRRRAQSVQEGTVYLLLPQTYPSTCPTLHLSHRPPPPVPPPPVPPSTFPTLHLSHRQHVPPPVPPSTYPTLHLSQSHPQPPPFLTSTTTCTTSTCMSQLLVPKLRAKPVRTASGIAVVAVMCKPHRSILRIP